MRDRHTPAWNSSTHTHTVQTIVERATDASQCHTPSRHTHTFTAVTLNGLGPRTQNQLGHSCYGVQFISRSYSCTISGIHIKLRIYKDLNKTGVFDVIHLIWNNFTSLVWVDVASFIVKMCFTSLNMKNIFFHTWKVYFFPPNTFFYCH